MVIESTADLRNRMHQLLSDQGFPVKSFDVSADAIEEIEASKKAPYTLIISSYMMPKMKGDAILKKAGIISPDSQRLLIADTADLETMVSAINEANIHACLTLPFIDEDFWVQINHCCDQFDFTIKQKNLKRITARQNKQLFKIASNFKKKSDRYASQIKKKTSEIRVLESRIQSAGGSLNSEESVSVEALLVNRKITITQKNMCDQFMEMKDNIKDIFDTAASGHDLIIKPVSYSEAQTFSLIKHQHTDIAKKSWPIISNILLENKKPSAVALHTPVKEIVLDDYFEISLSDENTTAQIKLKKSDTEDLTSAHVRQFLEKNKIINGIKNDEDIIAWLHNSVPEDKPFIIAQGKPAKHPKDAQIRYHFATDFLHAGKVNEDGSINFQDRGEIPYVEEDAFLAAKIFAEEGAPGVDVLGKEIPVQEPEDITFSAGPGTRMSDDGVRIYAQVAGQPHLDAMGNISVCPEYQLKGDIGFETGDVDFDGNVVVSGSVKQGFKVKCASLTAKEIQGAEIDISGDLNVSMGIVDTELVKVKGNVQAKFIRNSKINAFGDLIIQKEIVDSKIYLSGACINKTGSIINSEVSAKMGIDAGSIGNKSSKPSTLTVGVDENTNLLVAKVDAKLHVNNSAINELDQEIKELEKEDQALHAEISKHAFVQDRAQRELNDIEKKMENLKASGNMSALQKVSKTVEHMKKDAREAEEKINSGFERQDEIEMDVLQKKKRIKEFLDENKIFEDEKKRLREFSDRQKPLPEVKVSGKIESGTKFFAENSSLTLYKSTSHCKVKEITDSHGSFGGMHSYDMKVVNY